ncbi:GNAT family N-acetyltransferase [Patescibacteria group bacterium]|nr:GNAT family N-acetyltransferase [Patescibacteria group bacterium]
MNFQPLNEANKSNLEKFNSENSDLDEYLKKISFIDEQDNLSRVFVGFEEDLIVGFYSLSASVVKRNKIDVLKDSRYSDIPSIKIGRLANCIERRGKGFGKKLLMDSFKNIISISKIIGVSLVLVDAKNEELIPFYEHLGFKRIGFSLNLYISLNYLSKLPLN